MGAQSPSVIGNSVRNYALALLIFAIALRGARAFEAAFFDEDLAIRVVGDTLVLAPALIATEADIEAISQRSALSLTAWFRRFRLLSH